VDGYQLFRRDRIKWKGGGVAIYVRSCITVVELKIGGDNNKFELLWLLVKCGTSDVIIGALYHLPKPIYEAGALINYIETSLDTIASNYSDALVILAGDLNALSENEIVARTALTSIVNEPTRGVNRLDRIYTSEPCYESTKVVVSAIKSDHKAVVAYARERKLAFGMKKEHRSFRRRSPEHHAAFLKHIASLNIALITTVFCSTV
jgi:hypothetical protein